MSARPTAQTKEFFEQWQRYQHIIDGDYMAHRGVQQAIRQVLASADPRPWRFLDLGCGDAQAIAPVLRGMAIATYVGVDLSENALALAAQNLADLPDVQLIPADFLDYLDQALADGTSSYDVIQAGYTLHHLLLPEKARFFRGCRQLLSNHGMMLLYDVFRAPGQSRDTYIQSYGNIVRQEWTSLDQEQLAAIADHIQTCDFPETLATLTELATAAGLAPPVPLFEDAHGYHRLVLLRPI